MDVLIQFGFSIEEIQNMLNTNFMIESIEDNLIYELIDILKEVGCNINHLQNIFICNPFCLTNKLSDIKELINKLYELEYDSLYTLFDSNPYLLNLTAKDIDESYHNMLDKGMSKEDYFDYLSYHFIY